MAKLQFEDEIVEVEDGSFLKDAAEALGVPFGCSSGVCGTCLCDVISGEENLSSHSDAELEMDLKKTERLLCQCKIKSGLVKIHFE